MLCSNGQDPGDYNVANGTGTILGDILDNSTLKYQGYYWQHWEPYREYYHDHYHIVTQPDNFERAFKLSRKLMEKKLVKPMKTVEDFFVLMDAIVEVIK